MVEEDTYVTARTVQWEQCRVLTEMTCSDGLSLPDRTPVVPRFRTKCIHRRLVDCIC